MGSLQYGGVCLRMNKTHSCHRTMNWDEFYADYKKTVEGIVVLLYYSEGFQDFLKKVDKTGHGKLVKELFGSEKDYIDSPGNFHRNPEHYEHSIIYNYVADAREDDLISLFGFFVRRTKKCFDWTYQSSGEKANE